MSAITLTIDMDKKCAECHRPGAAGSGICMGCSAKAMDPKHRMKSSQGKYLQARYTKMFAKERAK